MNQYSREAKVPKHVDNEFLEIADGVQEDEGNDNKLLQGHELEKFGHDLNFKRRYDTSTKKKEKTKSVVNRASSSTENPKSMPRSQLSVEAHPSGKSQKFETEES